MTKIIQYPDERLSAVSTPFVPGEMVDAISIATVLHLALQRSERDGVGLAAPQIGINRCVFVLDPKTLKLEMDGIFINPSLVTQSEDTGVETEGCLSFPDGVWVEVERPRQIILAYISSTGRSEEVSLSGFYARAALHELDHLQGLLIDRFLSRQVKRQLQRKAGKGK